MCSRVNTDHKWNQTGTVQARNQNLSDFSARVETLAERRRVSLREVGPKFLGISTAQLFAYRSGSAPLSVKAWAKLESAEAEYQQQKQPRTSAAYIVEEPPVSYDCGPRAPMKGRMDVAPPFRPAAATPTREQCLAHICAYLDSAHTVEGGLGYAWVKLQKHFPLDDFETTPNP